MREQRPDMDAVRTGFGRTPTEADLPDDAVRRIRLLMAERDDAGVTDAEVRAAVKRAGGRLPHGPMAVAFALQMAKFRGAK